MNEPFIHIRRIDGGFEVKGRPNCALGHKIQNPARVDVDGIFVDWDWNGISLKVRNDRYGFYPVYYFANSNEIAISTSILQLLKFGASRALNYKGLAAFLYVGAFLGEDTPFRDINALPPNGVLEWQNGKLSVSGRITIPKVQRPSRDDAIDCYIALFRAAIGRRLPKSPTAVAPLTGGRDSRHIALELCRQGVRPDFCLTADYYPGVVVGNESHIAALISQSLGVKHTALRQTQPRINAEMRKNLISGFTAGICEHSWILAVRDYLGKGSCAIYDGIGGDVLSESRYLTKKRLEWIDEGNYRDLGRDLLNCFENRVVEKMFNREIAGHLSWEIAYERFKEEFSRHKDAPNPIGSYQFWNRTRRHVALSPYALLGARHDVFSPFLDNELFDFLVSLPASLLLDRAFHTDAIHRAYPAFKQIPWGGMALASKSYHPRYADFARDTIIYLSRKKSRGWMRSPFIFSRLTRCLFDATYSPQTHWVGTTALYFAQLEEVVRGEISLNDDLAVTQSTTTQEEAPPQKTAAVAG